VTAVPLNPQQAEMERLVGPLDWAAVQDQHRAVSEILSAEMDAGRLPYLPRLRPETLIGLEDLLRRIARLADPSPSVPAGGQP
jgi:hypothetical protein